MEPPKDGWFLGVGWDRDTPGGSEPTRQGFFLVMPYYKIREWTANGWKGWEGIGLGVEKWRECPPPYFPWKKDTR